jgi:hypothetical protein
MLEMILSLAQNVKYVFTRSAMACLETLTTLKLGCASLALLAKMLPLSLAIFAHTPVGRTRQPTRELGCIHYVLHGSPR